MVILCFAEYWRLRVLKILRLRRFLLESDMMNLLRFDDCNLL